MYTSIWWYLRVLPVLHRPEVVDIGVKSYIEKHVICLKELNMPYADLDDRYSNLFLYHRDFLHKFWFNDFNILL